MSGVETLLWGAGSALVLMVIGWLVGKYGKPYIHNPEHPNRLDRFQEIANIADRITDEMVLIFGKEWVKWIDKAVDRIIKEAGLKDNSDGRRIANREINYQINKKIIKSNGDLLTLEPEKRDFLLRRFKNLNS